MLSRDDFEQLVAEALDGLPPQFQQAMDNVEVLIEVWPSPQTLQGAGVPNGQMLLGLYHGIPLTDRTGGYALVPPDTITIFQGPIGRAATPWCRRIPSPSFKVQSN